MVGFLVFKTNAMEWILEAHPKNWNYCIFGS